MNDLEKQQKNAIEALNLVSSIFEKANIAYFLLAGTCLGAVRHKGFIPWDDDIDIGVFSEDYEKVDYEIKNNLSETFQWINTSEGNNYPRLYGKILKNHIPCIDIFRIVKIPITNEKKKVWLTKLIVSKLYARKCNWNYATEKKAVKFISKGFSLFFSKKMLLNICKWNERCVKENQKYNYCNLYSYYGLKRETIDFELLQNVSFVEFEGKMYPTVSDPDKYLTNLYGNYMEPVRENEQKPRHTNTIFY